MSIMLQIGKFIKSGTAGRTGELCQITKAQHNNHLVVEKGVIEKEH